MEAILAKQGSAHIGRRRPTLRTPLTGIAALSAQQAALPLPACHLRESVRWLMPQRARASARVARCLHPKYSPAPTLFGEGRTAPLKGPPQADALSPQPCQGRQRPSVALCSRAQKQRYRIPPAPSLWPERLRRPALPPSAGGVQRATTLSRLPHPLSPGSAESCVSRCRRRACVPRTPPTKVQPRPPAP